VANDIGDSADLAEVDALDERAVAGHADAVTEDAGGIDIALNAVYFPFVHDTPLAQLAVDDVMHPIDAYLGTNLITAMAVARHLTAQRSGTILVVGVGDLAADQLPVEGGQAVGIGAVEDDRPQRCDSGHDDRLPRDAAG
jgi:NADP-dependent 3-hydroxy acid dehydrogenase YdfG